MKKCKAKFWLEVYNVAQTGGHVGRFVETDICKPSVLEWKSSGPVITLVAHGI